MLFKKRANKKQVTALKNGTVMFDETYFQTGISQGGKMFWGGPFDAYA